MRVGEYEDWRVCHDPDDFKPDQIRRLIGSCRRAVGRHTLSERALARKKSFRERLVDHDDWLAPIDVATIDSAALQHPNSHRLEVAGGDRSEMGDGRDGSGRHHPPAYAHRVPIAPSRER